MLLSAVLGHKSGGVHACKGIAGILHQFAESLGNAIDAKAPRTRRHSEEVAVLSRALAEILGLPRAEAETIHLAGHLHDIGKIGVPDEALGKTTPLTAAEREALRRHPVIGADILRPVKPLAEAGVVEMVLHHHERWDGAGYPHGLAGDAIPYGARIIALTDSLSAMLQDRPYRKALSYARALYEIERGAWAQFDPQMACVLLQEQARFRDLLLRLKAGLKVDDGPAPGNGVRAALPILQEAADQSLPRPPRVQAGG